MRNTLLRKECKSRSAAATVMVMFVDLIILPLKNLRNTIFLFKNTITESEKY